MFAKTRLAATAFAVALIVALLFSIGNTSASPGEEDTTPPTLVWLTFEPAFIDTTTGPVTVTITARITDAGEGVKRLTFGFFDAARVCDWADSLDKYNRVEGDARDGIYQLKTLMEHGELAPGPYYLWAVSLQDIWRNTAIYRTDTAPDAFYALPITPFSVCFECRRIYLPAISSPPWTE